MNKNLKRQIFKQTTICVQSFVEQQDNSIKDLLQTVEDQYKQLSQQHSQIKEIENQVSQPNDLFDLLHWLM